jgi:hypothetical protein
MTLEGRIVVEEFDCEALKDNLLGDPHRRSVPIYLPSGYDRSGRRYPVIYWLQGWDGTGLHSRRRAPDSDAEQRVLGSAHANGVTRATGIRLRDGRSPGRSVDGLSR